jgi:hypothetical protein
MNDMAFDQSTMALSSSNDGGAPLFWTLQAECMKSLAAGDWETAGVISNTAYALTKGKGKGKNGKGFSGNFGGKAGGRGHGKDTYFRGGGKGEYSGKNGGKGRFEGACHHC